ncbi:RHS repeat-associated core domain-containing protein [Filimonas lacunae]|uniref:RHS repeat-associated core domain-containing protein n=1 Tax=Filimonas lacunae TaxID=477680 RepID=A0A173MFA6_9BACT|nr:DUF6531 domain-containing protein [Filimonas lacunae]BAV06255.1 Rhs-family protein [Filimonas lacunae]SIT25495.1 RHS repeat-associated core domain-containing protein [Filimonas lacunae]
MSHPKLSEHDKIKNAQEGAGNPGEEQTVAQKADQALQENSVAKYTGVADTFSGVHSTLSSGQDILTNDKASTGDKALAVVNVAGNLAMQAMAAKQFVNNLVNKITESALMPIMQAMAGPLKGIASLPIAKQMDPVMGIDVHFVTIPPAPAPIPMPHPYIGMIFNPKDWVAMMLLSVLPVPDEAPDAAEDPHGAAVQGAKSLAFSVVKMAISSIGNSTVKIGPVIPRAVAGTITKNFPHIPMGAGFHPAFMFAQKNHGYVFLGSLFVTGDGEPLASGPFVNNDCWDIGAPALFRITELERMPPMYNYVPSGFIMPIPWTRPILVNPVPTPINPLTIGERLFKFGLGKLKARKGAKGGNKNKPCSRLSKALHRANERLFGKFPGIMNKIKDAIGTHVGHPIDVAGGFLYTDNSDFNLPGPIPLEWKRSWYSHSTYEGPLGHGWHHSYDIALAVHKEERMAIVRLEDGRTITFDNIPLEPTDKPRYHRGEKMFLQLHEDGFYFLRTSEGLFYNFSARVYEERNSSHILTSVANNNGFAIRLAYDSKGWLQAITDSSGRLLTLEYDVKGRVIIIKAPDPVKENEVFIISSYSYSEEGDLISHGDALLQNMKYEYSNHLLVKELWRNGLQWFFKYDGIATGAKCIETWGTEGLLHYKVNYIDSNHTIAINSLGYGTRYYHQGGLVHKMVDAKGAEWHRHYNEFDELEWSTDPLGNQIGYVHDIWGNIISVTESDGQFTQMEYYTSGYPHHISGYTNSHGGKSQWFYDDAGNVVKYITALNAEVRYSYKDGLLESIYNENGVQLELDYNSWGLVKKAMKANAAATFYEYDKLGRCTQIINAEKVRQVSSYDLLGRLTSMLDFDDNLITVQYDAVGNILSYKDNVKEVSCTYGGLYKLLSRTENGKTIWFNYDTEGQLWKVVNEQGLSFTFSLDGVGDVTEERDFDGALKSFERNIAGWVTRVNKPAMRFSEYGYDAAGRVTHIDHYDNSYERFAYDKGLLKTATNENAVVAFEYDVAGNVVKELCNGFEVKSQYDKNGKRVRLTSSLGAAVDIDYDAWGNVVVHKGMGWYSEIKRDMNGFDIETKLLGNVVSRKARSKTGNIVSQWVSGNGTSSMLRPTLSRQYDWGYDNRLRQVTDQQSGITLYDHDKWGNLCKTIFNDGTIQYRNPDVAGNLFTTKERTDRKYNKGGQLGESDKAFYSYDGEGFLTSKKCKSGEEWKYEWNASGMLKRVVRPDGKSVRYQYDALGRKCLKKVGNVITKWVWDINKPLHEWKEFDAREFNPDALITWIFEEDSFSPVAKVEGDKKYSLISDHLGTPIQGYNDAGNLVWERQLDSYGSVKTIKGDSGFCNYLFQGQSFDSDIGWAYNRFRWYAPEEGMYVSAKDPIGLEGGLKLYGYVFDTNGWVDIFGLELVTVYHYTDKDGYNGIRGTGVMMVKDPSKRGKGAYKNTPGIYITKMPPELLAKEDLHSFGLINKKTEFYVKFEIDSSKIVQQDKQGRKLLIKEDVKLKEANGTIQHNPYSKYKS